MKAACSKGIVVGNFDQAAADDPVHDADVLGEAAAGGSEACGAADLLVDLALREGLLAAVVAVAAGDVVIGHDAVADGEVGDAFADADDGAGHLVAEDAGSVVRAAVDLLEVGAADAAGVDLDEHFAGADLGDGDGLDADVVDAAIDGGAHGCGNCLC